MKMTFMKKAEQRAPETPRYSEPNNVQHALSGEKSRRKSVEMKMVGK
jgi:hypothetical protein